MAIRYVVLSELRCVCGTLHCRAFLTPGSLVEAVCRNCNKTTYYAPSASETERVAPANPYVRRPLRSDRRDP